MTTISLNSRPLSLTQSFGVASLMIMLGVIATWVYLKSADREAILNFPDLEFIAASEPEAGNSAVTISWIQSGEEAYAAGRVTAPTADNALYYFAKALDEAPDTPEALAGLERVAQYLRTGVESSIFRGDWPAARTQISQIQTIYPDDAQSRLLQVRINRYEELENLLQIADQQIATARLTAPNNDNAISTYSRVLELDPGNQQARQGISSIIERLLGIAQSAALAGELDKARRFIGKARSVNPNAPGLDEAELVVSQWHELANNRQIKQQLEAASEALQAGRLTGNEGHDALTLFDIVLAVEPDSEAARQGKRLVIRALVDQAWTDLRASRFEQAIAAADQASEAGAQASEIRAVREEIAYQQALSRARSGTFDRIYGINELAVRRREVPEYPRSGDGNGWVTVRFTVSEKGEVRDAIAYESSNDSFIEAALGAINKWRFKPMMLSNRPIPVRGVVRFAFEE